MHWFFLGICDFTTNLNVELHNIDKGLNLAWSDGYKAIICELDTRLLFVKETLSLIC